MKEYTKIISDNEKVIWEGNPEKGPFFVTSIILFPFGLFGLFIALILLIVMFSDPNLGPLLFIFSLMFGLFGLIFTLSPLYTFLVYKNIWYVITDKRVILQGGIIGRDFEMVDFDKIQSAEVNVGLLDKLFGGNSGSISLQTGRVAYVKHGSVSNPYKMHNLKDPYKVFEQFKKVSHDVKTDIEYPNALRPSDNPGYNTKYDKDQK